MYPIFSFARWEFYPIAQIELQKEKGQSGAPEKPPATLVLVFTV